MADLGGEAFDAAGDDTERGEEHGVAVAGDDLGGDGFGCQAEAFGDVFLHARIQVCEGADSAADGGDRNFRSGRDKAGAVAGELGVMTREFQAEGGGFGVDAVAAADGQGVFVLVRSGLQGGQDGVNVGNQQVCGLGQLYGQTGVQHVGAGHALVDEAGVRPDGLGQPGQEGDDVVAGLTFDLVDALDVGGVDGGEFRGALLADIAGGFLRNGADAGHAFGGEGLDFKPDSVAVFGRPDGGHLRAGITRDHRCLVRTVGRT